MTFSSRRIHRLENELAKARAGYVNLIQDHPA